jgi:hypothetical protein
MYLCVNKSLKTAGISAPTSHILTVPFITALEQLREVRGPKHQGRKNIEWKAAINRLREVRGFKHQGRKNIEWKAANK